MGPKLQTCCARLGCAVRWPKGEARKLAEHAGFALAAVAVSLSAIVAKEHAGSVQPLAAVDRKLAVQGAGRPGPDGAGVALAVPDRATEAELPSDLDVGLSQERSIATVAFERVDSGSLVDATILPAELVGEVRWFGGRPIRPVRVMAKRVTAYSPDWRSCGASADGMTATLHSVQTNGGALVAADPTVLPYGTLLSIPGYDEGRVVPVLDCGGAIKGSRLDVLFATHRQARQWGVRDLDVIVWEYADGLDAPNVREVRGYPHR